jgi:glycerol transport system ATP-binding protein
MSVYSQPVSVTAAELFSEPPINVIHGRVTETEVTFDDYAHHPLTEELIDIKPDEYWFGIRPSHISLVPQNDDDLELSVQVELGEISGSETFMHVRHEHFQMVLQLMGVHEYEPDSTIKVYLPISKLFVFGINGELVHAPSRPTQE